VNCQSYGDLTCVETSAGTKHPVSWAPVLKQVWCVSINGVSSVQQQLVPIVQLPGAAARLELLSSSFSGQCAGHAFQAAPCSALSQPAAAAAPAQQFPRVWRHTSRASGLLKTRPASPGCRAGQRAAAAAAAAGQIRPCLVTSRAVATHSHSMLTAMAADIQHNSSWFTHKHTCPPAAACTPPSLREQEGAALLPACSAGWHQHPADVPVAKTADACTHVSRGARSCLN
jgi:hypothetical protein